MMNSHLQPAPEIPLFLRKTYALVDNCSKEHPSICSWTNEGTTFTVFDQEKFEQTQIPLYFKHSKFSSFVRQLNFYSFRKIKDEEIRIEMELATQNHWKFKHDLFQRGQPHKMVDMKRMTGKKQQPQPVASTTLKATTTSAITPTPVTSQPEAQASPEVKLLQQRIEEMNKNIHTLTAMVEKVSLKQQEQQQPEPDMVGSKRKKTLQRSGSSMKIEDDDDEDMREAIVPEPVPSSMPANASLFTEAEDDAFVSELFEAFNNDEEDDFPPLPESPGTTPPVMSRNRPDPQLMQKLSDCLEMLPKPIQEMIVTRLIEAITEGLKEHAEESHTTLAALVCDGAKKLKQAVIPVIPVHV